MTKWKLENFEVLNDHPHFGFKENLCIKAKQNIHANGHKLLEQGLIFKNLSHHDIQLYKMCTTYQYLVKSTQKHSSHKDQVPQFWSNSLKNIHQVTKTKYHSSG